MKNDEKELETKELDTAIRIIVLGAVILIGIFYSFSLSENDLNTLTQPSENYNNVIETETKPVRVEPLDVSALTPQTINKMVQKIKSSPNANCGGFPCIKTKYDSGVAIVTLIYELSADSLTPGSKEALVVEINTEDYLDENGKQIPQSDIFQVIFQFRDTDFDATPNEYWSTSFGQNMNFEVITRDTPGIVDLFALWAFGVNYFDQNLLR